MNHDHRKAIGEQMEKRTLVYDWLRQIFISEPSINFLTDMVHICRTLSISELSQEEKSFFQFFKDLKIEECENLEKEIRVEYARLFLGPKRVLAPPYESVYLSPSKTLFEKNTIEVREFYESAELQVKHKNSIPDDHLGYELEFMYFLSQKTYSCILEDGKAEDIKTLINRQSEFLAQHLSMWVHLFSQRVLENTTLDFFRVSVSFLQTFVKNDKEVLNALQAEWVTRD